MRKRNNRSKRRPNTGSDKHPVQTRKHKRPLLKIPQEVTDSVILFDEDEFYGIFLDLLLVSLNKAQMYHVQQEKDLDSFKAQVSQGKYHNNIYVIDELFGWGSVDIPKMIQNIRILDKEAKIVGATAVKDADINNPELYDKIVVKGKGRNENTMAQALSEITGVELQIDNSDPEYN